MAPQATVALFHSPDRPLEIVSVPMPVPGEGEILVDVLGCTLCGSDLHTCAGHRQVKSPTVLGHEVIGQIREFGPMNSQQDFNGETLDVGDRITWSVAVACQECFYCNRGLPQKCEKLHKYGHEVFDGRPDGGLASVMILKARSAIFLVPDKLSNEAACPANCATATAVAAVRVVGTLTGRTMLVLGAGMLGLSACALLHAGGAKVICSDPDPTRRILAKRFGAAITVAPADVPETVRVQTDGHGVDASLEFSGSAAAIPAGLSALRIGGAFVLVGAVFPVPPLRIEPEQFIRRQLRMFGIHNYTPRDLAEALKFLAGHPAYPFDKLVGRWFNLSDVSAALEHARQPGILRVGIRPGP